MYDVALCTKHAGLLRVSTPTKLPWTMQYIAETETAFLRSAIFPEWMHVARSPSQNKRFGTYPVRRAYLSSMIGERLRETSNRTGRRSDYPVRMMLLSCILDAFKCAGEKGLMPASP